MICPLEETTLSHIAGIVMVRGSGKKGTSTMTKDELRTEVVKILSTAGVDLGNVTKDTQMSLGVLFNRYVDIHPSKDLNACAKDWAEVMTSVCSELAVKQKEKTSVFRTSVIVPPEGSQS